jgi:DNA/RNA-binding domain of Phe-tRNA-synthetase-like protein
MWEAAGETRVEDEVRRLLCAGVIHASPVAIGVAGAELVAEIDRLCSDLQTTHAGQPPAAIPGLGAAREFYRAFGMDPTHTRPSSEALLRRVLQGKGLPRILNAVDLCNLCALRYLLPIGLYDAACVTPPVTLGRGRAGETYAGIRKDEVHLDGRPVLSDLQGPFGNPTSDSLRTSVTAATRSLVMVIFAPAGYSSRLMQEHAADAAAGMARHLAPDGSPVTTSARTIAGR